MRRLAIVGGGAAAVAGIVAALAVGNGATPVHRVSCPSGLGRDWRCRTVKVPLDRSGRVRGHVRLAVAEWHRPGPPREAVMVFAGGPGGAGIPRARTYREQMAPLLGRRDFIVFDQRGTGVSGRLSCPGVEGRARWPPATVAACGRRLGARAGVYASADSAADAEAVRRALGSPRLVLYGISYGTKAATDYARLYPTAVAGMVLDSIVVADTDPLYRRSAVAAARILRAECRRVRCASDPVGDHETLVARMHAGVLRGRVRGRPVAITEGRILNEVVEGGDDRKRLPAALHAAVAGDLGALEAALSEQVPDLRDDQGWLQRSFSATTYLATTCDDASFPWRAGDPLAVRERKARRWLAAQPDSDFGPFDHNVAAQYGSVHLCLPWPAAHARATLPRLPNVPALLLSGAADAITPLEGAREVAAELPRGLLVVVPAHNHVVLSTRGAAAEALRRWAPSVG
jgi:pimeloyl-ACP methyl ester carboxylesterase